MWLGLKYCIRRSERCENFPAYVYAGSRYHSVDGSNRFFISVGNHTLRSVASRDISWTVSTSSGRINVGTGCGMETGSRFMSLNVSEYLLFVLKKKQLIHTLTIKYSSLKLIWIELITFGELEARRKKWISGNIPL